MVLVAVLWFFVLDGSFHCIPLNTLTLAMEFLGIMVVIIYVLLFPGQGVMFTIKNDKGRITFA